jgi:general secretion pathway protein D
VPSVAPAAPKAPLPAGRRVVASAPDIALTLVAPASVKVNDQFSVQINETGAQGLYTAVYVMKYPENLEVQTQMEGPLLKQNGVVTKFQAFNDKKNHEIWMSLTRVYDPQGATGNGVLATVTFKALAKGSAVIALAKPNFTNKAGESFNVIPSNTVLEIK